MDSHVARANMRLMGIDHDVVGAVFVRDGLRYAVRMDDSVEWICEHGVGHYVDGGLHGCDGCCSGKPWLRGKEKKK